MLKTEHLTCKYGKQEILHDLTVSFPRNKITAIVGQSGCGKTTFLKSLNRIVEEEGGCTKGNIYLDDTDIKNIPKEQLR
ncbi:MAG: ATP-binding cassette domain-containing protein, partial [Blautia faecis]